MDLIMGICDHIHVLNFGCTLADGTADAIANDPKVVEAYLGAQEERMMMLDVKNLHVSYGGIKALKGVAWK